MSAMPWFSHKRSAFLQSRWSSPWHTQSILANAISLTFFWSHQREHLNMNKSHANMHKLYRNRYLHCCICTRVGVWICTSRSQRNAGEPPVLLRHSFTFVNKKGPGGKTTMDLGKSRFSIWIYRVADTPTNMDKINWMNERNNKIIINNSSLNTVTNVE